RAGVVMGPCTSSTAPRYGPRFFLQYIPVGCAITAPCSSAGGFRCGRAETHSWLCFMLGCGSSLPCASSERWCGSDESTSNSALAGGAVISGAPRLPWAGTLAPGGRAVDEDRQ